MTPESWSSSIEAGYPFHGNGAGDTGRGTGTRLVAGGYEVELVDQNPEDSRTLAEELGKLASSSRSVTGAVVVMALPCQAVRGAVAEHQEGIAGMDIVNPMEWSDDGEGHERGRAIGGWADSMLFTASTPQRS